MTQALTQTKIVETLGIIEPQELYDKLIDLNSWYGACSKKDFESWGISYESGKEEKNGKKFYLGLYNHDFEFIRRIILKYRDGIDYPDQEHHVIQYTREHKSLEGKLLEEQSLKGQLDVSCPCCDCVINKKNFKTALKKSFYHGGEREKENLLLVCENCFQEIGKQNVQDVLSTKKDKKSDGKQEVKFNLIDL